MASNLDRLSHALQNTRTVNSDPVADRLDAMNDKLDKTNNRLTEMVDLEDDIKGLLGKDGGGAGKEEQLKKIKASTGKSSITRVKGEAAGEIIKAATENLSKDLENFSKDEQDFFKEMIKKIGEMTEKNLTEFNKSSKQLIELIKKGQALAEKTGNKDFQNTLAKTEKQARLEYYKANNMGLRGDQDTFSNRFKATFGLNKKDETTKKSITFGTAIKSGAKNFASGFLLGKDDSIRRQLFTSNEKRREKEDAKNNWAPMVTRLDELKPEHIKTLAERGVAPKSEKDFAYRKDGKAQSLDQINAELSKAHDEKNGIQTVDIPDQQKQIAAEIEKSSDTGSPLSALQEENAGLSKDPVVESLDNQTKKLDEISDTLSQANELFDAIKTAVEKIASSIDDLGSNEQSTDGGMLPSIDIDLPSRRRGGSNLPDANSRKQTRSERARSQPRDAKGRFVKRPSAAPVGRVSRGRGILGAVAGMGAMLGFGALASSDDSDSTDIAANTAMTAADLAPDVGSVAGKTEAKSAEKATVKGVEKATAKGAEKAVAKGAGKVVAKEGAKVGAKAVGKSLLKKIPGVGLIAGLGFGAQRLMGGDWKGALGEVASGAASTIPGIGTAASVAIDAGLAARDMGAFDGGAGGTGGGGGGDEPKQPMKQGPGKPVQGKSGGIFSKVGGFIKKNPLMTAGILGGAGLAAVGAKKAWDWMSGDSEDAKVESGQNPDSAILEKGSDAARDQMNVNVPPPTIINQGGGAAAGEKTTVPNTKSYVRDDESSWMRFALKRAMA